MNKKYHNPNFTSKHIKVLYTRGKEYQQQVEQWIRLRNIQLAAAYDAKLHAIVEMLESITVFHIGDGINGFAYGNKQYYTIDERLESFKDG